MQKRFFLYSKKIFVFILFFIFAFFSKVTKVYSLYYDGTSWVSSTPSSSSTDSSNNSGGGQQNQQQNQQQNSQTPNVDAQKEAEQKAAEEKARLEAEQKQHEQDAYDALNFDMETCIEKIREKESEITKKGKEIDRLEDKNKEIEKEISELAEKQPIIDFDKIPQNEVNKYKEYITETYKSGEDNSSSEKNQKIYKLLVEQMNNDIALDYAKKDLKVAVNEYQQMVEPIIQALKDVKFAGDPVDITNGKYIYSYSDKILTRKYESKREGVFGKNWISNLDSRIIRCKTLDFSEGIKLLKNIEKNCEKAIAYIGEIKNKHSDYVYFQNELKNLQGEYDYYQSAFEYLKCDENCSNGLEVFLNELNNLKESINQVDNLLSVYEQKKSDTENKIIFYEELNNLNAYIDEVNKYVSYDEFKNPDSYILMYGFIYFVDENGIPILCRLNGNCYEPLNENLKDVIKIYGLGKNGEISLDGNNECGFVVESLYGEKKYYSKYGQLERIVYKNGLSKRFEYSEGKLSKIILETGEELFVKTNSNGKIISVDGKSYGNATFEYKDNMLCYAKDCDDIPVLFSYNSAGYLSNIKKADNSSINIEYEQVPNLGFAVSKVTNEIGEAEYFEYDFVDNTNRKTTHTSISAEKTVYYSNSLGQITSVINHNGKKTEYEYNENGVYSSITENGEKRIYVYDMLGQLSKIEFEDGSEYCVEFDDFGNLTKEIDRDGNVYEWTYDSKGNQTSSRYNSSLMYECEYNSKNQLSKICDDNYQINYEYNQFGNVSKKTTLFNERTLVETWEYDEKNRPVKYENSNGDITVIEYGEKYTKETYNNEKQIETFLNNRQWQIKTIVTDLKTGKSYTKELIYDNCKRLKMILIDGNIFASYTYKTGGLLKSFTQWNLYGVGYTTEYVYDSLNRLVSEIVYEVDRGGLQVGEKYVISNREYKIENENSKYEKTTVKIYKANQKNPVFEEYDNKNRIVKITQPDGFTKKYLYSNAGKLIEESDSNSVTKKYFYNQDGTYSICVSLGNGSVCSSEYDKFGRLVLDVSFANEQIFYEYDSVGNITKQKFANGEAQYVYDHKGRIISIGVCDLYGQCVNLTKVIYKDENKETMVQKNSDFILCEKYDFLDRLIERTDKSGRKVFDYDCLGNVVKETDSNGNNLYFEHNPCGNISKITDDKGNFIQILYYPTGHVKSFLKNGKVISEYSYNDDFELISQRNDFINVNYDYDDFGIVNSVLTNHNGNVKYDILGRKNYVVTNSMNQKYQYELDQIGNVISVENPANKKTTYVYDKKNRIVEKKWYSGKLTKYLYDDFYNILKVQNQTVNKKGDVEKTEDYIEKNLVGQIVAAKNEASNLKLEYDLTGNLICYEDIIANVNVKYEYDNFERLISKKSDSFDFVYSYDVLGNLEKIEELKSNTWVSFEYEKSIDGKCYENLRKFSNGSVIKTYYDNFGRTNCVITKNSLGQVISADFVSYDDEGKIRARCDATGKLTIYEYDEKDRVVCEKKSFSKEVLDFYKNEAIECGLFVSFDESEYFGDYENVSSQIANDFFALFKETGVNVNLSVSNYFWVQKYDYNLIGSLTSSINAFGKILYEYDNQNRLVYKHGANTQTEGIRLTWNDDGQLIKIFSSHNRVSFEYGAKNRPIAIYNEDLFTNECFVTYYSYDAFGRRISETDKNGNTKFFVYDGLSSNLLVKTPTYSNNVTFLSEKYFEANYDESIEYKLITNQTDNTDSDVKTLNNSKIQTTEQENNSEYKNYKTQLATDVESGYKNHKTYTENRVTIVMNVNNQPVLQLYADGTYASGRDFEIMLNDYRKTVVGSANSYSDLHTICDYDCWGNPILYGKNTNYNNSLLILDSNFVFYDLGYRDYSPVFKCFTTEDPFQDGYNWYAYCCCDAVNFVDVLGFAKQDIAINEKIGVEVIFISYSMFDEKKYRETGSDLGIHKGSDCADVSCQVSFEAYSKKEIDYNSKLLSDFEIEHKKNLQNMENNEIAKNYEIGTIDFINDTKGENFSLVLAGYSESDKISQNSNYLTVLEALKNPDTIGPGTIIMFANPNNLSGVNNGWVGHAALVLSREFDANGNVIGVLTLQGHSDGVSTELEYIGFDSSCDPNKHISAYLGELFGLFEIGGKQTCAK